MRLEHACSCVLVMRRPAHGTSCQRYLLRVARESVSSLAMKTKYLQQTLGSSCVRRLWHASLPPYKSTVYQEPTLIYPKHSRGQHACCGDFLHRVEQKNKVVGATKRADGRERRGARLTPLENLSARPRSFLGARGVCL
jgi:hypothetical protein